MPLATISYAAWYTNQRQSTYSTVKIANNASKGGCDKMAVADTSSCIKSSLVCPAINIRQILTSHAIPMPPPNMITSEKWYTFYNTMEWIKHMTSQKKCRVVLQE
jgi:hypothetical protein